MPRTRAPYAAEFLHQMVELVRAGRTPEELSREFEPTAQTIHPPRASIATVDHFTFQPTDLRANHASTVHAGLESRDVVPSREILTSIPMNLLPDAKEDPDAVAVPAPEPPWNWGK